MWRVHGDQSPTLASVAASGLGAAASSVGRERDISIAGRLLRGKSSTFSPASMELRSLVSANADLVTTDTTTVGVREAPRPQVSQILLAEKAGNGGAWRAISPVLHIQTHARRLEGTGRGKSACNRAPGRGRHRGSRPRRDVGVAQQRNGTPHPLTLSQSALTGEDPHRRHQEAKVASLGTHTKGPRWESKREGFLVV